MIYLDNAATSLLRPSCVGKAFCEALASANPGRSGHAPSLTAGRRVLAAREELARFFHTTDPFEYIFTANCTEALNLAILGTVKRGDRVIISPTAHNSILRPLTNAGAVIVPCRTDNAYGHVCLDSLEHELKAGARLAVLCHVSNVTGVRQSVEEASLLCKHYGVTLLIDGAQAAGSLDVDISAFNGAMYAFPGHKGLLGPQGTGVLYLPQAIKLPPLRFGGTGSSSLELTQPEERPDKYESGTINVPGIHALGCALRFLTQNKEALHIREKQLTRMLYDGLSAINGVHLISDPDSMGIVTFTLKNADSNTVADALWSQYAIAVRGGLHCAPLMHRFLGTENEGAVRMSCAASNDEREIYLAVRAVKALAQN